MYFIFASSTKRNVDLLESMGKESISWCVPKGYSIQAVVSRRIGKERLVHAYSFTDDIDQRFAESKDEIRLFHGYLLREPQCSCFDLDPKESYYGVYSHGEVTKEDCFFASDEIGLSPLYYSKDEGGSVFVSNNPHLIALYKRKLGVKIKVEPTLSVWHAVGITNESDATGYQGIKRVEPWRFICIDVDNRISFPSKRRLGDDASYKELCYAGIQELREGMATISSTFENRAAQLTGGFDSRLVLSFIMDHGDINEWRFETKGLEGNPDCIVAKMLGEKYGLSQSIAPRTGFKDDVGDLDEYVKEFCMANAMESSLVRLQRFAGIRSSSVLLNGMGAAFAKSFGFASSFQVFMRRKFRGRAIDFGNLTEDQYAAGYDCFGHADADRFILKESGLDVVREFRKRLFCFGYNRFQDNMNYADSMSAYRWRTHNCNLSTLENNMIFLYSPVVLEASRKLDHPLRQDGKLYFDMMWRVKPDLCFVPFENRVYNPELYKEFPEEIKSIFRGISPVTGSIVSEDQITFFDIALPRMREELVEGLPDEVFDYVKRDAVEERLIHNEGFGKPVFALLGLYGIMKWYELVDELNSKEL